jgi:hypothetical protein
MSRGEDAGRRRRTSPARCEAEMRRVMQARGQLVVRRLAGLRSTVLGRSSCSAGAKACPPAAGVSAALNDVRNALSKKCDSAAHPNGPSLAQRDRTGISSFSQSCLDVLSLTSARLLLHPGSRKTRRTNSSSPSRLPFRLINSVNPSSNNHPDEAQSTPTADFSSPALRIMVARQH